MIYRYVSEADAKTIEEAREFIARDTGYQVFAVCSDSDSEVSGGFRIAVDSNDGKPGAGTTFGVRVTHRLRGD